MSDGILLRGLDGSNPLAFLAALGTLRTLSLALPDESVKMSWEQFEGAWRPRVFCSLDLSSDGFVATLDDELGKAQHCAAFTIGDNLNLPAADFRKHLLDAVKAPEALGTPAARVNVDFLAAFGSEAIVDKNGAMADSALRTMSGAGHQHFLKFIREIVVRTDADHLRRALLMTWDYADEGRGMNLRWDPSDDRRYALRWSDPSTDPSRTMRGANRLAIEGMPLLPTMPVTGALSTTAFAGKGARDTTFTWAIWGTPIGLDVVRTLLAGVANLKGDVESARHVGVRALFSAARITTGKFRNFTPAAPA